MTELRPHHLLDILSSYGNGEEFAPHEYGHALHIVGPEVLAHGDLRVKFIVGADAICRPCRNLTPEGRCTDVLGQLSPSPSKQEYNDDLDRRVLAYLGMEADTVMTVHEYFARVNRHVPGIEEICTHPKEDRQRRLAGLARGLEKVGVRRP